MTTNFIRFLIDPFNIFWILLLVTVVLYFRHRDTYFRYSLMIVIGWLFIISTPLVPVIVLDSLESRYEPINTNNLASTVAGYQIVVLGGGHGFDDRLPANSLLSLQALARLNEAVRLHRQLPNSRLVLSGYSASGRTSQAEMLAHTAALLGVAREKMVLQTEPGNTFEEGKVFSENYDTGSPVILVTSASHMPRAVGVFQYFGIDVIPSPAHFRLTGERRERIAGWPSDNNISHLQTGMSEYAALFRDRLVLN